MKETTILAIESSCDETAAAVVQGGRTVLSNCISSQIALHQIYGGVVPEIASARQIAMYLAKQLTSRSLPEIGRKFDRDHTTVMHAVRKVEELILEDASLAENVDALRRTLES